MSNNFRESFSEMKVGFMSVYPSISDVLHALSMRFIPWFSLSYDDGRKKSIAIVEYSDAANIVAYKNILMKIQDFELLQDQENSNIVFRAIMPAIMGWVSENNYISCTRTLASFFIKISENDKPPLSVLIADMSWHLNEEYKQSTNNKTKNALLVALKNLESIGG